LVLSDKNFDEAVKLYEYLVVEFYAPWCGHCKNLAPEYEAAAGLLRNNVPNLRLAKVDATVHSELAEKFEVEGYPTLKLIVNGQVSDFQGGRTANDIVNYLLKKTGPAYNKVETEEELLANVNS